MGQARRFALSPAAGNRSRRTSIDMALIPREFPDRPVSLDVAGPSRIVGVVRNGRTAFVWRPDDALFYVLSPAGSPRDMYIVFRTSAATTAAAKTSAPNANAARSKRRGRG